MKTRAVHVVLLMVISTMVGYYVGVSKIDFAWKQYQPQITIVGKEPPQSMSQIDFNQFWTVWQKLQNGYYDKTKIDPQKMLNGAISGMVDSLDDPYTMYLPRSQNDDFKSTLAGKFQGIGAELGMVAKQIIVVAPLDGSPASKSGIKPGDAILKVNGVSTFGWTLGQAVEKIRGPKDTKVTLTILHKSAEKAVEVSIVRDTISIKSVEGWVKEVKDIPQVSITPALVGKDKQRIAYIRLSQFGDSTNIDWTP
ncbi:MAG: PDZ domain-containing protein, partial [Patescibacteria group bacterium]